MQKRGFPLLFVAALAVAGGACRGNDRTASPSTTVTTTATTGAPAPATDAAVEADISAVDGDLAKLDTDLTSADQGVDGQETDPGQ
jgi:hypothetical protein